MPKDLEKYKEDRIRLKKLIKLSKKGLTIVPKKGYYKNRLEVLEEYYKDWKDRYPEFFI